MKIIGKKLRFKWMLPSAVLVFVLVLGIVLWNSAMSRLDHCEYHAQRALRINEMLVLMRVEIPQYLANHPDISQQEFVEYVEKIKRERDFSVAPDLSQWRNPDHESTAIAVQDGSPLNIGYCKFNGIRGK